jgi:D-alanyl-D-alanine dipeptidase
VRSLNPSAAPPRPASNRQGAPEPIAALNRVRILELAQPWIDREPLVDIRHACPDVAPNAGICPYLRREVAAMLNQAQAALPSGYRFRVGTALRTLAMQRHGWDNYFRQMQAEHPEWPLSALRRATNKFFAPYDQKAPPGHCTGGAVDVLLLDSHGNQLDLTSPTTFWEGAYTWSDKISPEAKANRMILVEAMLGAGFSNCRDEYWHYSYGDSAWAVRVGQTECPYGWAHPPVELDASFEDACATDLVMETFRNESGHPTHAEGSCALLPSVSPPRLRVGLYWASGIPTRLKVHGFPIQAALPRFTLSADKHDPIEIEDVRLEDGILELDLISNFDRANLTGESR